MPQLRFEDQHLDEYPALAIKLLETCKAVRIFAFFGNLGAGKTTLIQHICRSLGVREGVTSPTFTLVHSYQSPQGPVHHFDLYRLTREEEAEHIGLTDYLDSGEYVFIEWPERIPSLLPEDTAHIHLQVATAHSRHIELTY